jgi:hypothetical protein
MGLNEGAGRAQNNFLLVYNEDTAGAKFPDDLGFNIKTYQVQRVKGTLALSGIVKEQIEIYYNLKPHTA